MNIEHYYSNGENCGKSGDPTVNYHSAIVSL